MVKKGAIATAPSIYTPLINASPSVCSTSYPLPFFMVLDFPNIRYYQRVHTVPSSYFIGDVNVVVSEF
ncbi:hypothetical protein ACE4RR_06610 [Alteribacillus sp. HJP-4]